jgi:hypothetical protein
MKGLLFVLPSTQSQTLAFILTHVENLWAKMISTNLTRNAQIPVNTPGEAIRRYGFQLPAKVSQ